MTSGHRQTWTISQWLYSQIRHRPRNDNINKDDREGKSGHTNISRSLLRGKRQSDIVFQLFLRVEKGFRPVYCVMEKSLELCRICLVSNRIRLVPNNVIPSLHVVRSRSRSITIVVPTTTTHRNQRKRDDNDLDYTPLREPADNVFVIKRTTMQDRVFHGPNLQNGSNGREKR